MPPWSFLILLHNNLVAQHVRVTGKRKPNPWGVGEWICVEALGTFSKSHKKTNKAADIPDGKRLPLAAMGLGWLNTVSELNSLEPAACLGRVDGVMAMACPITQLFRVPPADMMSSEHRSGQDPYCQPPSRLLPLPKPPHGLSNQDLVLTKASSSSAWQLKAGWTRIQKPGISYQHNH